MNYRGKSVQNKKLSHFEQYSIVSLLLIAICLATFRVVLPEASILIGYLIALNTTGLVMVSYDKWQAGSMRQTRSRVPEQILFLLTAFGGSVGVLTAMLLARHKTRKGSFQIVVVILFLMQLIAIRFFWPKIF